jgi:DNA-binding CsgD family transcriptional regulator
LADVAGTAAELAHHCLASHDVAGAFAASVLAGHEAEELAAPAEAHRHYERALSLWDRVTKAEELAGVDRGTLAFRAACSAADSGQVARAVHELRALAGQLTGSAADPVLVSKVLERLAYLLSDMDEDDEATRTAQAAVDVLPERPATRARARALAMHARTLLVLADPRPARSRAEEAAAAARAAGAPGVEADALVTLGLLSERTGDPAAAKARFRAARDQAHADTDLAAELRAAFNLARICLEQGDLEVAGEAAAEGTRRAAAAGLSLAPYGLDLRYLHYLAHYADGKWDHAQEIADSFPVRVTSAAEARLSAMAMFIDVARGSPRVDERWAWLQPFRQDAFTQLIASGLLAEHALWRGEFDAAVADARTAIRSEYELYKGHEPPVIRVAAVGIGALAEKATHARAAGDTTVADPATAAAAELLEVARAGASFRSEQGFRLGIEGQGWLARAEAEYRRAAGDNDPSAWRAVVAAFDHGFAYETARSRWRLAEALAEGGDRDAARQQWLLAIRVADELRAAPLRSALTDLGRRARLGSAHDPALAAPDPAGQEARGPLAGLTDREREVLELLAAGRSNREIGAELFISAKTASVHVSNILAKLGAASRTEAAAIAHREGVGFPG